MLVVPKRRTAPTPAVLALNYFGNHTLVQDKNVRLPDNWMPGWGGAEGSSAKVVSHHASEAGRGSWTRYWPIEDLIDRGYALATFYNGDIDPDTPEQRGLQKFFRQRDPADDRGTTNGRADLWINPAGHFEVLRAAAPVYRLLSSGDFTEGLPPDGHMIGDVLGYYLRPGGHSLLRDDWRVFLDFADQHLGRPN